MLRYGAYEAHRRLAQDGITVLETPDDLRDEAALKQWSRGVCQARLAIAYDRWRTEAMMCAQLSQTDGAVVFDEFLVPCAFGLFIHGEPQADDHVRLSDSAQTGRRGTRHQSALRFVKAVRDSFAIVLSHDGGVTILRHGVDGQVTSRQVQM